MILVTGATGHFGKAAIDFLLKKGIPKSEIAALVRDESKAAELKEKGISIRIGDYDNYDSLVKAFKGTDKLLLVSGNDIANRSRQQENAVKAAKEASVKYIVYTSFDRKNETDSSPIAFVAKAHLETEKNIKATGIPYTILRNNLYMDFIPMFIGDKIFETGIFFPAGDTSSSFALRSEMAEAAANILAEEGHEGREYAIANTEEFSFNDIAAAISKASGKTVSYTSPAAEVYTDVLTKAGVPAEYIGMFAGFGEAIKQGEFNVAKSDLQTLLGRTPTSLKQFIEDTYDSKK
jgi:NAD(P)H dehydrogenase (quinone)